MLSTNSKAAVALTFTLIPNDGPIKHRGSMPCPQFSFLVLSDIHFGDLAEHPDFALPDSQLSGHMTYQISMRDNLVAVVRESGIHIDAILAPGDLTTAAAPKEFSECWQTLLRIADALGVSTDRIFYTFGNHDCNWRISSLATENDDEGFHTIASSVGTFFCKPTPHLRPGPVPASGTIHLPNFELFIANSGYFCLHDQAVKHGRLGEPQFTWLQEALSPQRPDDTWRVLMIHHHSYNVPYPAPVHDLSFLEEGDSLVEVIASTGVDFVCFGHRHHPMITTRVEGHWLAPVTFFCSGSVSVNANERANGQIPNLFHIVTLSDRHNTSGSALGTIRSFRFGVPRGWVPHDSWTETVPLDLEHNFGSIASQAQRNTIMKTTLATAIASTDGPLIRMPTRDQLDADLRFCRIEDTNAALRAAAEHHNGEVVRSYPEQPIVVLNEQTP